MPETTPLIKAALNLRVGAGFDVYGVGFDAYIQTYENIDIPHAVNFYFFKFFKQ